MMAGKRLRRTFTEAVKKQIAARQQWVCSVCETLLDSTYQVDHSIPLWKGGMDSPGNATAMCANCHARKTQAEGVERGEHEFQSKLRTRKIFEKNIWIEEEAKRATKTATSGVIICRDCSLRYYPMFIHKCSEVARRSIERIEGKKARHLAQDIHKLSTVVFEEYYCTVPGRIVGNTTS
jgi:5-methylcytosine-specific restriction endonuclease McrA